MALQEDIGKAGNEYTPQVTVARDTFWREPYLLLLR